MSRRIVPLPVPAGARALAILPALAAALDGTGPALAPHPEGTPSPLTGARKTSTTSPQADPCWWEEVPDDLAVVVGTSGSTGTPKLAMLTASALATSAAATIERLGGPGDWLLALPAAHIAGLQVLLRALLHPVASAPSTTAPTAAAPTAAAHPPTAPSTTAPTAAAHPPAAPSVTALPAGPFDAAVFAAATAALPGPRRYSSLVPAQLARLLSDDAGRAALASYDAVLVGGAATPAELLERARAEGIALVTTYGSSETCGGCVYDGLPLAGVQIGLDGRRVRLSGPMLAAGYLGDPDRTASTFALVDGVRWYRTDDLGALGPDGRLRIAGRADDAITTGGYTVDPRVVEKAMAPLLPEDWQVVVVGVPDPTWGQIVGAAFVPPDLAGLDPGASLDPPGPLTSPAPAASPDPGLAPGRIDPRTSDGERALLEAVRRELASYAVPRRLIVLDTLPLLGPGKPDRAAVRAALAVDPAP